MAIKGISMDATQDYVSDLDPAKGTDREKDDSTIFILGTIASRVQTGIRDKSTAFRQEKESEEAEAAMTAEFRPNESTYLTVQFGLKGWKRFLELDGEGEIEFKTINKQSGGRSYIVASPESMDRLGLQLMRELAEAIDKLNSPTWEEAKS